MAKKAKKSGRALNRTARGWRENRIMKSATWKKTGKSRSQVRKARKRRPSSKKVERALRA